MTIQGKDGKSELQTLLAAEKELKRIDRPSPPELIEFYQLECPIEFRDYYEDFIELSKRRSMTEAGAHRLTWVDIQAWASLNKIDPSPLHISTITMLDDIWISEYYKKHATKG